MGPTSCQTALPRDIVSLVYAHIYEMSMVPEEGLEPSSLAAYDFESYVYTIPPLRLKKYGTIINKVIIYCGQHSFENESKLHFALSIDLNVSILWHKLFQL